MKRVHLIGICGTGMSALAAMLKVCGFEVSGSDCAVYPPMSNFLKEQGITPTLGYRAENVEDDLDLVIVGNAISRGNPELEEVLNRKIRYASLPEILRDRFLWGARSIVIAGTHGKTTTAAITSWLLYHGSLDPNFFIGGVPVNFNSGYRLGCGRDFVIEGDEYDSAFFDKTAKFLKYLPDIAVVGNIEFDHADIYETLESIRLEFRRLVSLVPRQGLLFLGNDSDEALSLRSSAHCRIETFGLSSGADWRAENLAIEGNTTKFEVYHSDKFYGVCEVGLVGSHNIRNTLAALAVASHVGLDSSNLIEGLRRFLGVKRRLELKGTVAGVSVYDDFAHHPTAITETVSALRTAHPGRRIWAVFEPRSASACSNIFQAEFVGSFLGADEIIIAGVYRDNLPVNARLSVEKLINDLQHNGQSARYGRTTNEIVDMIVEECRDDDVVLLMSNGSFDGIHQKLLEVLKRASSDDSIKDVEV